MAYSKPTVAGRKLRTRKKNTATMNAKRVAATKKAVSKSRATTTGNKGGATRGNARSAQVQSRLATKGAFTKSPNGSTARTGVGSDKRLPDHAAKAAASIGNRRLKKR